MEVKIGEYIRDKNGVIGKVVSMERNLYYADTFIEIENSQYSVMLSDVTKHSNKISELIEEGDYVNNHKVFYAKGYAEHYENVYIHNILTHEQYDYYCNKFNKEEN